MKRPTDEQFDYAMSWLEANESDQSEEFEACQAMAKWLKFLKKEDYVKKAAKAAHIPVKKVREKLKQNGYYDD